MEEKKLISIVVPCYNEEDTVDLFLEAMQPVMDSMEKYRFELLFVNDGSKDKTLLKLRELVKRDKRATYISFSRNFGKESAMYAGLCNARGDYVATMDVDLQDPPDLLPEMLRILETGEYDCVATRREDRKGEPKLKSFLSDRFYDVINKISETEVVNGARDFRMMKREMVDAIVAMGEYNRFSKGIFGWVGFRTHWISYNNRERSAGSTKWNFRKLLKYALDGIVDFSEAPLNIASWFGLIMVVIAAIVIVFVILRRLIFGDPVQGWASLVCIITFIGGLQLFCLGIIGKYLSKVFLETKNRPHYIISETNREDTQKIR